ncbi:hypothetical protein DFJ58DRAFT_719199 [Suillus subalutaceus]|uniref:uncharacterized protein n=1 Tax=Suillus subalutaceus TaxID=48586 RepID=UPI001B880A78|nr:uncharacterized protein DFJ58DRAFT_719199 [Suillus subalutaceus]KAG1835972.1 hypothetical protein DFJ58DRAFT_719199 [Suillus subalutaceus]
MSRRDHNALQLPCGYLNCVRFFKTQAGRTKHWNSAHRTFTVSHAASVEDEFEDLPDDIFTAGHDDFSPGDYGLPAGSPDLGQPFARPCDVTGQFLEDGAPPLPPPDKSPDDWTPYRNRVEFETAEFLYTRNQMSAGNINILLDLWAATLLKHNDKPPFADCHDLYKTIDSTPSFKVQYTGEKLAHNIPPWMDQPYDVWYHDPHEVVRSMLANPEYAMEMDYQPYCEYLTDSDECQWQDFMSSDWAWNQADIISEDPETLGSMFVPVVLGSDKTTVSVATGANDYYPLYVSIGNEHASDPRFRKYRWQLFHSSLAKILENLKPGMTKPEIVRFGDGHYRCVIYGLGPYIADYEEQALLACIVRFWCPRCMSHRDDLDAASLCWCRDHTEALVEEIDYSALWLEYGIVSDLVPFTNDFPRGDIHELIAPDILHQLIKGTFKDHLVTWVGKYLRLEHGKKEAERIQDDIDQRITTVASFAGLRRFPEGQGFKQWTGDDSKALMKVYLPAIQGHVPTDVVCAFRPFLEFCYLVWCNVITESMLVQIQEALDQFHQYREILKITGVIPMFSLPRQHSCSHYILLIRLFGAPNGLCSSITETKHIKAVKEPWRRSSRYKALGQILLTNQCLDKLAVARVDFKSRGMLNGTCLSATLDKLSEFLNITVLPSNVGVTILGDNKEGKVDDSPTLVQAHHARTLPELSTELAIPHLSILLRRFLFKQLHPNDQRSASEVPLTACLRPDNKIQVFNSACSTFYALSDHSGIGGMRREHIRSCPVWRNEAPRYDCVLSYVFFTFTFEGHPYPCAVVRWFNKADDQPDEDTGMWIVTPSFDTDDSLSVGIIHIDTIYRATHLIPIYGPQNVSRNLKHYNSYDVFQAFYVNKFADHHAFEIAS